MKIKVNQFISMFEGLQEIVIYPIPNEEYTNEFMFEEVLEEKPIFQGRIKDIPYYLLNCTVHKEQGSPMAMCQNKVGCGGTFLMVTVEEDNEFI